MQNNKLMHFPAIHFVSIFKARNQFGRSGISSFGFVAEINIHNEDQTSLPGVKEYNFGRPDGLERMALGVPFTRGTKIPIFGIPPEVILNMQAMNIPVDRRIDRHPATVIFDTVMIEDKMTPKTFERLVPLGVRINRPIKVVTFAEMALETGVML